MASKRVSETFSVGRGTTHERGAQRCEACIEGYPDRCGCGGGLVHADKENGWLESECDKCGSRG